MLKKYLSRETINTIAERFLSGDELSYKDIIAEYITKDIEKMSMLEYIMARDYTKHFLSITMKYHVWREHHAVLACLDSQGHYGIVKTQTQAKYVITQGYTRMKGNVQNIAKFVAEAQEKQLLPKGLETDSILLPNVK